MGLIKLLDSMIYGVVATCCYGTWLLIFGAIALVFGIVFWSVIKWVIAIIAVFVAVLFLFTLIGVNLSRNI